MRKGKSKLKFVINLVLITLLVLSAIFFVTSKVKQSHFQDAQIDEILFYIKNGFNNGQSGNFTTIIRDNILFTLTILFLLLIPIIDFYRNKIIVNFDLSFLGRKKHIKFNPSKIPLWLKSIYVLIVFSFASWTMLNSFGVFGYIKAMSESSQLYETYYVNPKKANLIFPDKKRNLIYIYLESMENTIASRQNGGQAEVSLIPELENLALDPNNVSFSNNLQGLGGAVPIYGTTWTAAAMTAQSSGVPLKMLSTTLAEDGQNGYNNYNKFLPGAYSLGQILEAQGYNQTFLMGSDASFGGRDKLLDQHGNYKIVDYTYAKEHDLIPKDYSVWWGFEDKKLIDLAKAELDQLSSSEKPFNLQLLTADTHFTDGYLDETCPAPSAEQYDNVYSCSSRQIGEFVDWVKKQKFADNTTIVIVGDHLGMQSSYYGEKITDPNYVRTTYNVIINPAIRPIDQYGRLFSTMDMYPTTLASMGVIIENDRLGLGTNLFADKATLTEIYGSADAFSNELTKRSELYEKKILTSS